MLLHHPNGAMKKISLYYLGWSVTRRDVNYLFDARSFLTVIEDHIGWGIGTTETLGKYSEAQAPAAFANERAYHNFILALLLSNCFY